MAIALGTYKSSYYIKPSQVTLMANDQNNPSLVYVGVRSGTYVEIYYTDRTGATPDQVIGYGPNSSYQKWQLSGSSTKLASNAKHYIYIRLRRTEKTAMLIFSTRLYDFYGENPDGVNHAANRDLYYYILAGELTATDGTSQRELTFQTGNLSTPENSYDKEEADSKFLSFEIADQRYLNQVENDTAKGIITFLQGIKIGSWEGENTAHSFQLRYDETLDSVVLSRTDGKPAHFLATGALSTRGLGEIESGGGGTGTGVDLLNVPSDIIPIVGGNYSLGSSANAWKTIYANGGAIGTLGFIGSGVISNGYMMSINSSWVINPDGSATFSSLTINGANAATQNWVNSQSFAKISDLSAYVNAEGGTINNAKLTGDVTGNGWSIEGGIANFGEVNTESLYINGEGVLTSSSLANYVTLNSAQTISGKKTFTGGITVNNGITASHLYSVEYLDSSELIINVEKVNFTYYGDDADVQIGLLNGYKPLTLGNTSFSPALTSGTVIGTITIGGESKTIYAPNGGSADLSNYVTLDGEQNITGSKYFSDLNANSIYLQGFELKPYSLDGGTPDRLMYDGGVLLDEYNYGEYLDSAYVKKSGDTVTGQLGFSGRTYPQIYGNGTYLILAGSNENKKAVIVEKYGFRPYADNSMPLGISGNRWHNVYSVKGNFSGQITSTVADGTAPFVVASKTRVSNLNAEYVNGYTVNRAGFVTNTDGTTTMIPTLDKQCNVFFSVNGLSSYWTKFATITALGNNSTVIVTLLVGNEHQGDRYQGRGVLECKIRNDSSTPRIYFSAVSGDIDCSCFRCYYPTTISSGTEIELWVNVKRSWNSAVIRVLNETSAYAPINVVKMFAGARNSVETPTLEDYVEPERVSLATKLSTPRTIWGQSFDGSGNVSGNLTGVGDITGAGAVTINSVNNTIALKYNGNNATSVILNGTSFKPYDVANGLLDLGSSSARWKGIYGNTLDLSGHIYLPNTGNIYAKNASGSNLGLLYFSNANNFLIGQGVAKAGYNTIIYGNNISLAYGTAGSSSNTALYVNSDGNVGIGTTSPSYKLDVNGNSYINGVLNVKNHIFEEVSDTLHIKKVNITSNATKASVMQVDTLGVADGIDWAFGVLSQGGTTVNTANSGVGILLSVYTAGASSNTIGRGAGIAAVAESSWYNTTGIAFYVNHAPTDACSEKLRLTSQGNLIPKYNTSTQSLGSSSARWVAYLNSVDISGNATVGGETVATQVWVNSQNFVNTSDLTSINNSISSLQASTFTGANAPEGKGYTLTWFTQSGGGRNVTIPAYGEVGTVATDGLAGIGQNVALVDQWLIADLISYVDDAVTGGCIDLTSVASDIIPDGNLTRKLGSSSNRWSLLYVNSINAGTIAPRTDNGWDLGMTTFRWRNLYAVDGHLDSLTIGGETAATQSYVTSQLGSYATTSALSNYVTLNTEQTISGKKTFTGGITVQNGITASHLYSVEYIDSSELIINAEEVNFTYFGDDSNILVGLINGYKPLTLGNTSFSPALTSGTVIGTITIGGESKTIFAPNGGSVDLSNYVTLDSEQTITGSKYFSDLNANSIYLQGFELKPYSLDGSTPDRLMYDGYVLLDEYNYSEYLDSAYVKKSDDTVTGQLGFSGNTYPHIYGNGKLLVLSGGVISQLALDYVNKSVRPSGSNVQSLGNSANRWSNVYSVLGNFSGQITSTVADGTSPFVVASKTEVANLHSATATKLHTARTIAISGAVTGTATSFDGSSNVSINTTMVDASKLSGYARVYYAHHPEDGGLLPFIYNDLAHLIERGGSCTIYKTTDTDYTQPILTNAGTIGTNYANLFDGSPSYFYYSVSSLTDVVVIDIDCLEKYSYGTQFYIDFGLSRWGARNMEVYVWNDDESNTTQVYAKKAEPLNVGARYSAFFSYSYSNGTSTVQGFNKLRVVLTDFVGNASRITQIGLINYDSLGLRYGYMSRGIDDVLYRSLTPAKNSAYHLGTSANKWGNVYASNFYGNIKLSTARTFWGQSFDGSGNISGDLTGVGNIYGTGAVTINSVNNVIALKYNGQNATSVILNNTSFKPYDVANGLLDLGSTSARWKGIYGQSLDLSGGATIGGSLTTGGNILPSVTKTLNLGQADKRWNVYAASLSAVSVTSSLTPDAVDSRDLGSTDLPWYCGYIDYLSPKEIWFNDDEAYSMRIDGGKLCIQTDNLLIGTNSDALSNVANRNIYINGRTKIGLLEAMTDNFPFERMLSVFGQSNMYGIVCGGEFNNFGDDMGAEYANWWISPDGSAFFQTVENLSDATKKSVIGNVQLSISDIAAAPSIYFTWTEARRNKKARYVGTTAQYWNGLLPELVSDNNGVLSLDYATLGVTLGINIAREVNTMKMWKTSTTDRIEELEEKVKKLEEENKALRELLNKK